MSWNELEKIFNRALSHTYSKRKCAVVFPVLALCGLLIVICRSLSYGATQWIQMSLTFLPMFLVAGLLLAAGLVLIRVYHHQVKGLKVEYLKIIKESKDLFLGIPYLAVPLIFTYLVLWMVLGVFYLLKSIPQIGNFVSSILSFGPFLLVFGSLILAAVSLLTLFYITPAAALRSNLCPELAEEVIRDLKKNPFMSFIMPLAGLIPLLLVVGFLCLAVVVTQTLYHGAGSGFSLTLKWFFMMLPFCALLTPVVIFFFNFSAESYVLMRKSLQNQNTQ